MEKRFFPLFVLGALLIPAAGAQAASDQPYSQPGRYYLKLKLQDTDAKDLFNVTGGQPYPVELAIAVLGRHGGNPAASTPPQPKGPGGPTPASKRGRV